MLLELSADADQRKQHNKNRGISLSKRGIEGGQSHPHKLRGERQKRSFWLSLRVACLTPYLYYIKSDSHCQGGVSEKEKKRKTLDWIEWISLF